MRACIFLHGLFDKCSRVEYGMIVSSGGCTNNFGHKVLYSIFQKFEFTTSIDQKFAYYYAASSDRTG